MLKRLKKQKFNINRLSSVPEEPGVYIFFSKKRPLYVGKSVNLKNRLRSYKQVALSRKTSKMISQAKSFSYIVVASEVEALLLEAKLVNLLQTPYNIQLKDDKHPLYIRITNDKYPLVLTARKINQKENYLYFYGPFPSSSSVKRTLKLIRKIFPYAQHLPQKRACIYSQMGLCKPCPSVIEKVQDKRSNKSKLKKDYKNNIKMIVRFLNGDIKKVKNTLTKNMKNYSSNEMFEEASLISSQLKAIEYITSPKNSINQFLENPYLLEDIKQKELTELKTILFKYISIKNIRRIECYDVAHLSGSFPTASMVTFINAVAEKNLYRHFKIRQKSTQDDTASLKEVAKRRKKHLTDWGVPDLMIVDGGKGQVGAFEDIFKNINVPIVGIAKKTNSLIIQLKESSQSNYASIKLPRGPALNLIQRLRDESHRFARRLHHKLVKNDLFQSS
ncbi:GIY-YIG nuclease family protein [Patescibacteria group bacterium]